MEAALAAARLGDPIEHSNALLGFAIGAAVGLGVGIAMLGAVVAAPFTGGLSLVAGVAAVAALGGIVAGVGVGATAGGVLGGLMSSPSGPIVTGSPNVFINGRPAARAVADTVACTKHSAPDKRIAQGSGSVSINDFPAARKSDRTECDGPIAEGSPDVFIGAGAETFLSISPEIPEWASRTAHLMTVIGGAVALGFGAAGALIAGACATAAFAGGIITGVIDSTLGRVLGGAIGEAIGGEKGRIAGETLGELAGIRGARNALRSTRGHPVDVATGELLVEQVDFEIAGPLPFTWSRSWLSSSAVDGDLGSGWSHPFDMALEPLPHARLVQVRLEDGRLVFFPLPDAGAPTLNTAERLVLHREGERYRVATYDGVSSVFARGADGAFRLIGIADASGNRIAVHRGEHGRILQIEDSGGRLYAFAHDPAGRIVAIDGPHPDDARGRQRLVSYAYTDAGELAAAIDARGGTTGYRSVDRLIVAETRRGGLTFQFRWDDVALGRRARCIETWGDDNLFYCRFEYAPEEAGTLVIDDRGGETLYRYNSRGTVDYERDPLGHEQRWRWSAAASLLEYTDPMGRKAAYAYDALNRLTRQSGPGGATTELTYAELVDAGSLFSPSLGLPVAATRPGGGVDTFEYDSRGQLVAATDPLGQRTRLLRDERGLPLTIVDDIGVLSRFGWSGNGDQAWEADARGNRTDFATDALGRITAVRRGDGETRYDRDPGGNVTAIRRVHDGATVLIDYDAEDHVTAHRDARGRTTRWDYAGLPVPVRQTGADGRTIGYEYDRTLNLTAVVNAKGERWSFDFDAGGRLQRQTGYDGRREEYRFDAAGLLVEREGASGVTRYENNEAGQLVARHFPDGSTHAYAWDAAGRLIAATTAERQVAFAYDAAGRSVRETQDGQTISYRRDGRGRTVATELPDGRTIAVDYDADDAFTAVALDGRAVARVERDAAGRETARQAGALATTSEYDSFGRLTVQRAIRVGPGGGSAVIGRRYAYDPLGQLTAIEDMARGRKRYRYDVADRLIGVDGADPEAFVADPAGNVLPMDVSGQVRGEVAGDRLRVWGDRRFDYDADGRRTRELRGAGEGREFRYRYDGAGQLAEVREHSRLSARITRFGYDALGRRAWKDSATVPPPAANGDGQPATPRFVRTSFLWSDDLLLAEGADVADPLATLYLHEPGSFRPLALVHRSAPDARADVHHYQLDQLGTPQELVNDNGLVTWRADLKAWGSVARVAEQAIANPLRFQGQYADAETGLHYNRHRYYDPEAARYVTPDPIGLAGGLNSYRYVPDPASWVDPLGLACTVDRRIGRLRDNETGRFSPLGPKGDRLPVRQYMSRRDITEHLAPFRQGAAKIVPYNPTGPIGTSKGHFVMSRADADAVIARTRGDPRLIEKELGMDPGYLGDKPNLIAIDNPRGLRMPTGNEPGANEHWIPGGRTSGGVKEAVIGAVQPGGYQVIPITPP